jgi:hypothetical protein
MSAQPKPDKTEPERLSAVELVRRMEEENAPRRERVLRGIQRLYEIAEAKERAAGRR